MRKILIIEDEENVIKAISAALEMENADYEIHTADGGKAGLEKARKIKPDLILLDLMMPDMNGIDVCRSLKSDEKYKTIQIVILTGLGKTDDVVKGLSAGADDYVSKPFNMPELMARVKTHLRMKELYDAVKKDKEDNAVLLDVSQSLSNCMDSRGTLYVIVSKIAEIIKVKRCSIIYVNMNNKKGIVMASHDSKEIKHLEIDLDKYPEIQHIIKTGKAVVINDVYNDPILFPVRDVLNVIEIRSIMAFPITLKDELIGTLILRTSRRESPFTEREIRFCEVISHLSAAPLKNAYLFEVLHKEKEKERNGRVAAEKDLKAVVKDLTEKNESLEKFHRVTVGRELEMIKLKEEINTLLEKLGRPKKYEVPDKISE